jgi:hypothetical protein
MLGAPRSSAVRFGPIRPRRRAIVTLRMRGGPIPRNICLRGLAVTARRDVPSSTRSRDYLRCRV